jgi:hypothetical protein
MFLGSPSRKKDRGINGLMLMLQESLSMVKGLNLAFQALLRMDGQIRDQDVMNP